MSDEYVHVTAIVQGLTQGAVLLDTGDVEDWVPRSCIHGGDDSWLTREGRNAIYQEREFRVREWQAKLKGFV